jgi:hypothetical protein
MQTRLYSFLGGRTGPWRVSATRVVSGDPLPPAERVEVIQGEARAGTEAAWILRGVTSHERYVTRPERARLVEHQPALGRLEATHAAFIPIRKSPAWWSLAQDERRTVFEARSAHIATGLRYLPAVARRLHHCRDLAPSEPFDFLTWFEFAPADATAFDELLDALRASEEWQFVEREVEVRVVRES